MRQDVHEPSVRNAFWEEKGERGALSSSLPHWLGLLGGAYYMSQTDWSTRCSAIFLLCCGPIGDFSGIYFVDAGSRCTSFSFAKRTSLLSTNEFYFDFQFKKFRMRKMLRDLTSICILSTMVLVTLATTVALQTGQPIYWRKAIQRLFGNGIRRRYFYDSPTFRTNQQDEGAIERPFVSKNELP